VTTTDKDERGCPLSQWRRAWRMAGLAIAAVVNVLWIGMLGYALVRLL
jgi:hypothetical protein